MDKHELLRSLGNLVADGTISKAEVFEVLGADQSTIAPLSHKKGIDVSGVLSAIGGAIVFLGLVFLVAQNWDSFSSFARIFITLGSGLAFFASALALTQRPAYEVVASALYFVSACIVPIGLGVTFYEFSYDNPTTIPVIISLLAVLQHAGAYIVRKRNLVMGFLILTATWFFFALTNMILNGSVISLVEDITAYRVLCVALSYLAIGFSFSRGFHVRLQTWMYRFGLIGFFASVLALGGWKPDQHIFWELVFPVFVFMSVYFGSLLKSRDFLWIASLSLMAYIIKITFEYFEGSIGWPLSLIFSGCFLIAVAYGSVVARKKYFS